MPIHNSITPDKIIRSRRKTVALQILSDGTLIIRAPWYTSPRFIEKMIQEKARWIAKKQTEMREKQQQAPRKKFMSGEKFLYLGQFFPLTIVSDQKKALLFDESNFLLSEKFRLRSSHFFTQWYKENALNILRQRVAYYAERMDLRYSSIRITSAKTRWGSCSPGGKLNFTWRLIMAPIQVIDSVVVHELAHIQHPNHGKRFWAKVEKTMPEYKKLRSWLNKHGHRLSM